MADKQNPALKRLTKKLNALRKTLRADERNLLDRIVLGDEAAAEVQAHRVHAKAAKRVVAAEVEAHRLAGQAASATRSMVNFDGATNNYIIAAEGPEVEGHAMAASVTLKVANKVTQKNAI